MISIKKYIVSGFITFSVFLLGQVSTTSKFPQNIESVPISAVKDLGIEKSLLTPKEQLDININSYINDATFRNANWGFIVYDPKNKKIVSSYNESTPLVPASTTKLLTTETAMNLLSEKFVWNTQLEYSGSIDETGILNGNLYIVGSGDPSLGTGKAGSARYSDIVLDFLAKISEKGITKVNGDIIIQTAVFKENKMVTLPENIVWLDGNNYYLPVGSTANIEPRNEKFLVKNNLSGNNKRFFYVSPYIHKMVYSDVFEGNVLNTKLPDAPAFLANNFRKSLIKNKIPVTGKVVPKMTDINPEERTIIATYKSPTLGEIIYETNQKSDNALSEAILRMVGFQKFGDQTLESGKLAVVDHLKNISMDFDGLNYVDGSGLSRSNTITPIAQVKFLSSLMKEKYFKNYFDSLPIAGQTGTLKKMFFGNGYGQIFAKTGTLNKVKCLAGYIKTNKGTTLAFSLLVNNYNGSLNVLKSKMERLLEPTLDL